MGLFSKFSRDKERKRERELFLSIENGNSSAANKLLRKGISPNCDSRSFTESPPAVARELGDFNVLHYACACGQSKIVQLLLQYGADVETLSGKGFRPVHCAVIFNRCDVIETLSNCKAELNSMEASGDGNTALHLAVIHNSYASCKCLLQLHVDLSAVNKRGETALELAKAQNLNRIIALLEAKETDAQYKLNIEKLATATLDTQKRLSKVEDATLKLEHQLPLQINAAVDSRMRQMVQSWGLPCGRYPAYDALSIRSDYVSMEEVYAGEAVPDIPTRARSFGGNLEQYTGSSESLLRRPGSREENEWRRRIRMHFPALLSNMKPNEILPILYSRHILTDQDYDTVNGFRSDREKNAYILRDVIMRSSREAYEVLKYAMHETDQIHLLNLLEETSDEPRPEEAADNIKETAKRESSDVTSGTGIRMDGDCQSMADEHCDESCCESICPVSDGSDDENETTLKECYFVPRNWSQCNLASASDNPTHAMDFETRRTNALVESKSVTVPEKTFSNAERKLAIASSDRLDFMQCDSKHAQEEFNGNAKPGAFFTGSRQTPPSGRIVNKRNRLVRRWHTWTSVIALHTACENVEIN